MVVRRGDPIDERYPIFDELSRGCSTPHNSKKKKKDEVSILNFACKTSKLVRLAVKWLLVLAESVSAKLVITDYIFLC